MENEKIILYRIMVVTLLICVLMLSFVVFKQNKELANCEVYNAEKLNDKCIYEGYDGVSLPNIYCEDGQISCYSNTYGWNVVDCIEV